MRMPALTTLKRIAAISIPLLLFVTLVAWGFTSTVGSSPDDDYHLPSIWCGLGERAGLCEDSGDSATRLVPAIVADVACFAFESGISGACWDASATGLSEARHLNTGPQYPPLFYAAMSTMAGPDVQISVLLMRTANALLAVGLLTAAFFALPRALRPSLLVSTLTAIVPLGLFIIPSTNPSSWALLSAALTWICLLGTFRTIGRRRILLAALAVLGAIVGAGARADAAAFAVFGVIVAFVLGARRGLPVRVPLATGGAITVISVAFYLGAGQGLAPVVGLGIDGPALSTADHISNLLGIPGLWLGVFGSAPLGWLDTSMPTIVPVLAFGSFGAACIIGLRAVSPRRAIALGAVAAALWAVPFVLLAQSQLHVEANLIQPRYILPLLVILIGVASATSAAEAEWSAPRAVVIGVSLSVAASLALHVNLQRYTTGADQTAIDPGKNAEWWWPWGPSPLVVWLVGSAAFALVFVVLVVLRARLPTAEGGAKPPVEGSPPH